MSTQSPNEPEHAPDHAKNQQVEETIGRLMETSPPNIGWMSAELANRLLHAMSGSRTLMMMSLLRAGMSQEAAEKQADMQWPLLAFDLGLRVGTELESVRQMRELFGDDPPEFP